MLSNTSKHFAQHATESHHATGPTGRSPHGLGAMVSRAVRGAMHVGSSHPGAPVHGAIRASGVRGVGGGLPQSAPNDLAGHAAQQLKILQDIYNQMTGSGINVIVKNTDLQARFG